MQVIDVTVVVMILELTCIVGLRTLLLREMVFTLCLKLFLDYLFQRNPMVPTTF